MTTKPYVSGAAYILRMSDYCDGCSFDPKANCPFTSLYWAFLARHAAMLKDNPRLRMPMVSLGRRPVGQRLSDQSVFRAVGETLLRGDVMRPEKLPKLER
jgi:deoxyribodipyrimidine photolyase-related protein